MKKYVFSFIALVIAAQAASAAERVFVAGGTGRSGIEIVKLLQAKGTVSTDRNQVIVLQRECRALNPVGVRIHLHDDFCSLHPGHSHAIVRATERDERTIGIEGHTKHRVV